MVVAPNRTVTRCAVSVNECDAPSWPRARVTTRRHSLLAAVALDGRSRGLLASVSELTGISDLSEASVQLRKSSRCGSQQGLRRRRSVQVSGVR
eukprot:scaffold2993_cov114-Isochrysis_galbana.AAC.1